MSRNSNTGRPAGDARRTSRHIGLRVALVLFVLLALVAALFAWNRWFRYDDAADLQGVWRDQAGAQLAFDGSRMLIGDSVVYDYTVDAAAKTISYDFNGTQGCSAYCFSGDRSMLALRDVEEGSASDWLMVLHVKEDPLLTALDPQASLPEGCSRLQRVSDEPHAAFEAYEQRPASLQEIDSGTVVWPEDMGVSSSEANQEQSAPIEEQVP